MMRQLVNIANRAKTDAQRNAVGNALLRLMDQVACTPDRLFYKKGKKNLKITSGVETLGKGAYGAVFYGCLDDKCRTRVAIKFSKKSLESECVIGKRLEDLGVAPRVYRCGKCAVNGMYYMYYEYASHGSLDDYLKKHTLMASDYKYIIYRVLRALKKIQKKYPTYKHYDLHTGNVLINMERGRKVVKLADFGLSEMKGVRSPHLKEAWRKSQPPDAYVFLHFLQGDVENLRQAMPPTLKKFFDDVDNYPVNDVFIDRVRRHPFLRGARLARLR
jgi:serine/threonine protein kinase